MVGATGGGSVEMETIRMSANNMGASAASMHLTHGSPAGSSDRGNQLDAEADSEEPVNESFEEARKRQIRKVFRDIRASLGGLSQQAFGEALVEVGMPFGGPGQPIRRESLQGRVAQWESGRYPPPSFWEALEKIPGITPLALLRLSCAYGGGKEPPPGTVRALLGRASSQEEEEEEGPTTGQEED